MRGVQRAALVVLGLAVAVVVAVAIGFAGSDSWTGETSFDVREQTASLGDQGPTDAGGAGARFEWLLPDNATRVALQVAVAFNGQAVQGGSATVLVRVTMPDGRVAPDTVAALAIPAGATTAALVLDINATWLDAPSEKRDVAGNEPAPVVWSAPLVATVVTSPPSDLPLATYGFTAAVGGVVSTYTIA